MAFPSSPTNGQLTTVNNVLYVYDSSKNTWTRVPGNTILGGASNAYANVIFDNANSAFAKANSSGLYANGAFIQANAAFEYANTLAGGAAAQFAFTQANAAYSQANTATSDAAGASLYANAAFLKSNTAITNATAAGVYANASFNQSNTATTNAATADGKAITAGQYANSAYSQANTATTNATAAGVYANGAFLQANTGVTNASSADSKATSAGVYANGAFIQANTATNNAATADSKAVSAGNYANTALIQANIATTNAADATILANVAIATANSKVYTFYQNTAPTTANTRDQWVNSDNGVKYQNLNGTTPLWVELGPTTVTTESPIAQAAFDKANTAITTSGGSITGRLNVAFAPASTVNTAILITAANTKGGAGYADVLQLTNTSGGASNPNKYIRLTSIGELQVVNSSYQMTPLSMTDAGDVTLAGNLTMNGISSGYAPNRPAFRIIGNGGQVAATTTLTGSNWTVDFNQGGYLNNTTGIFTAPVAGLYQVNALIRTSTNSSGNIIQAVVKKTAISGGAETIIIMIEFGPNTSMNHAGGSTIIKLAVGDTLKFVASAGTISFDGNDNWSVAYIG